jgi:hypothetical protein
MVGVEEDFVQMQDAVVNPGSCRYGECKMG